MSEDNDKLAEITADSSEGKDRANPSPTLLILLILPLFGIFVALLMLALETRQQPAAASAFAPAPPRVITNFEAPDFELPMLDGVTLASPADYAGRPLFLNFWATWCQPCVRELPAFEEFVAEHSANPDGPALLAIHLIEEPLQLNYRRGATVLGFVHFFTMLLTLTIYANLVQINPSYRAAAADLGASRLQVFLRITLPLTVPGIMVGAFLTFVITMGDFITPQILGGASELLLPQSIILQIQRAADFPMASAMSVLLMLSVTVAYFVLARWLRLDRM